MGWTRRNFLSTGLTASAAALSVSSLENTAWSQTSASKQNMASETSVPRAAQIAIGDMLDHGAHLKSGQRVLMFAYLDGLYGGPNLVDGQAMHWIQRAIEARGNKVEMLWLDEPSQVHQWKFPAQLRAALDKCDVAINNTFDLTMEEILEFRDYVETARKDFYMVRNFATTSPLLCSSWAQTPQELVSEIRYQASLQIEPNQAFEITDPNGTHIQGTILPASAHFGGKYAIRREDTHTYLPWPEWVCAPISLRDVQGTFVFDRMLSWWSRYIGIAPYFEHPVTLAIENGRITKIEGGAEAEAIRRFIASLSERVPEGIHNFDTLHFGVHPQAHVSPQQCPSVLYRRIIEHSDTHNLHVHIGSPRATPNYPYWPHITGDLRKATFRIGDKLIHENGQLTAVNSPAVLAIAAKYPGRPGLLPEPYLG